MIQQKTRLIETSEKRMELSTGQNFLQFLGTINIKKVKFDQATSKINEILYRALTNHGESLSKISPKKDKDFQKTLQKKGFRKTQIRGACAWI